MQTDSRSDSVCVVPQLPVGALTQLSVLVLHLYLCTSARLNGVRGLPVLRMQPYGTIKWCMAPPAVQLSIWIMQHIVHGLTVTGGRPLANLCNVW